MEMEIDRYTVCVGPDDEMGKEAGNDVVVDRFHVFGGGIGEERSHVQNVSNQKAGFGATHSLFLHYFPDASWSHPVTTYAFVSNLPYKVDAYHCCYQRRYPHHHFFHAPSLSFSLSQLHVHDSVLCLCKIYLPKETLYL